MLCASFSDARQKGSSREVTVVSQSQGISAKICEPLADCCMSTDPCWHIGAEVASLA